MVTATVDNDTLAGGILLVPNFIVDEMRKKTSTSAEFREGAINYYMQYSHRATWDELAGELYYWECGEALAAARRFIKRTPGKCIYIYYVPLSGALKTGTTRARAIIGGRGQFQWYRWPKRTSNINSKIEYVEYIVK